MFTVYDSERPKQSRLSAAEAAQLPRVMAYLMAALTEEERTNEDAFCNEPLDVSDPPFYMRFAFLEYACAVYLFRDGRVVFRAQIGFDENGTATRLRVDFWAHSRQRPWYMDLVVPLQFDMLATKAKPLRVVRDSVRALDRPPMRCSIQSM